MTHDEFCDLLSDVLTDVERVLTEKNRKYGNSALEPSRVFSRASPLEQLNVRIDDKISRLQSGQPDDQEDAAFDLLGYLLLREVAKRQAGARSRTHAMSLHGLPVVVDPNMPRRSS